MNRKEITTKEDLMKVIELFENTGITYWLDGGWGVDILAGKQTRIHRDIDINFDAQHTEKLLNVLLNLGYKIDTDWKPVRIELYSDELGYLDIHPFVLNEDGTSKQADLEGGWYEFEKDYFGSAFFEGKTIPCISLKGQRVFHSGYELRDKDKHDISIRGCKIFCVYGNETFQIRIRYVVVFVGFCSRIFCRIYLSGYSISCPLSFIHAF